MTKVHSKLAVFALAAILAGCLGVDSRQSSVRYVDTFDLEGAVCGYGKRVMACANVDGAPLTVDGMRYARGIGTHPESAILFRANGKVKYFDAQIAIDDVAKKLNKTNRRTKARFRVWADGCVVFASGDADIVDGKKPVPVHVELDGAREIVLETASMAPWIDFPSAYADWLDARFTLEAGGTIECVNDARLTEQLGILTPPEKDAPQFNGADIWGVRPGHEVIFRVPVSGVRPMRFRAKNLPDGVTLDAWGVLRGKAPKTPGKYDIVISAENEAGSATRTIRLAVGDTICLTPPMGWNSWNIWGPSFSGEHAIAAAQAMDASGLANHGWSYINLDDFWEMNNSSQAKHRPELHGPTRDKNGKILPNPSFKDMKGLTDRIHELGLKAGLYSSPGAFTCGGCEGSYKHELQDAESWADWGFDYVKYDWCSYGSVYKEETGDDTWSSAKTTYSEGRAKPYRLMGECLKKQKRDIVFSFCQYGLGEVQKWGREAGGNCWRSWHDLKDGWTWMEMAIDGYLPESGHWMYTGPGFWADPDMMIVGLQRSFGSTHPTFLTPNEQYTHVSLWAMVASPMLIGCDLTKLDDFTRSLLINDEVIAISQDRLGRPARRLHNTDAQAVWMRPLANGDIAVALVNRYPFAREIRIDFEDLGTGGAWRPRDVWRQVDEDVAQDAYSAVVPPHATKLVRFARVKNVK